MRRGFLCFLLLVLSPALSLAETASMGIRNNITGEEMLQTLTKLGYVSQLSVGTDGMPKVESVAKKWGHTVRFYECDNATPKRCGALQINMSFDFKDGISMEHVNKWNAHRRFIKLHRDAQHDPTLEMDVNLMGGVGKDYLNHIMEWWELGVDAFAKEMIKRSKN